MLGHLESEAAAVTVGDDVDDARHAVDVAGDEMAAQLLAEPAGALRD